MPEKIPEETREGIKSRLRDSDSTYSTIADEFDVSVGTVGSIAQENNLTPEDLEAEQEAEEEIAEYMQDVLRGRSTHANAEDIGEIVSEIPGIGNKKAKSLQRVVERRDDVLKDPNALYKLVHRTLETDEFWTDYIVKAVFPDMDEGTAGQPSFGSTPQYNMAPGGDDSPPEMPYPNYTPPQSRQQQGRAPPTNGPYSQPQQQGGQAGGQQSQLLQQQMQQMQQMMEQQQQFMREMVESVNKTEEESEKDRLREEIEELKRTEQDRLREEIEELKRELTTPSESESPTDSLKELVEAQKLLDDLTDDDSSDDANEEVVRSIQALQQEMRSMAQDDTDTKPALSPDMLASADPQTAVMASLASGADLDPQTITELATTLTDDSDKPAEVQKAEVEKEIKQMETKQRQEMIESVFDNLDGLASGLLGSLSGGDDEPSKNGQTPAADTNGHRTAEPKRRRDAPEAEAVQDSPRTAAEEMVRDEAEEPELEPVEEAEQAGEERDTPPAEAEGSVTSAEPDETPSDDAETQPAPDESGTEITPDDVLALVEEHGWDTSSWQQFQADARSHGLSAAEAGEAWDVVKEAKANDPEPDTE